MIPRILHYIWIGGAPFPPLVERCVASWHQQMPDWEYREWNEQSIAKAMGLDSFDEVLAIWPSYVREALEARKFAFVSDYVRLWALEREGGVYMDVDFEVYRSFEPLLNNHFFAGYEGSKRKPVMMGVIASEPHGVWVSEMMHSYDNRSFRLSDGSYDLTPNTGFFSDLLETKGFIPDGIEKDVFFDGVTEAVIHVYPVHYFCPVLTTGESLRNEETFCEHKGLHSWSGDGGWKAIVLYFVGPKARTYLIKLKRKLLG